MNLKQDLLLMSFKQEVSVTSLSFRTDATAAELPLLASSGGDGRVCLWDLKERRLHHTMGAHEGSISKLQFLPRLVGKAGVFVCVCEREKLGWRFSSREEGTFGTHPLFATKRCTGWVRCLFGCFTWLMSMEIGAIFPCCISCSSSLFSRRAESTV